MRSLFPAGKRPQRSLTAYGSYLRALPHANEQGLRMLIGAAVKEGAARGLSLTPLFSLRSYHGSAVLPCRFRSFVDAGKRPQRSLAADGSYLRALPHANEQGSAVLPCRFGSFVAVGKRPQRSLAAYVSYLRALPHSNEQGLRMLRPCLIMRCHLDRSFPAGKQPQRSLAAYGSYLFALPHARLSCAALPLPFLCCCRQEAAAIPSRVWLLLVGLDCHGGGCSHTSQLRTSVIMGCHLTLFSCRQAAAAIASCIRLLLARPPPRKRARPAHADWRSSQGRCSTRAVPHSAVLSLLVPRAGVSGDAASREGQRGS
jgi:hypothetical protein